MRPTTALPLVTTREPTFFACSQLVALLTLASGAIVATSAPFCLRMLSMDIDIGSSNRMALLPISSRPRNWGACHGIRSPLRGALAYPIGSKQSASIGDRATDQSLANWCVTGFGSIASFWPWASQHSGMRYAAFNRDRFRRALCLGVSIADGLGQHLAQLGFSLWRFAREGFCPCCHKQHMGMPQGELNPRLSRQGSNVDLDGGFEFTPH